MTEEEKPIELDILQFGHTIQLGGVVYCCEEYVFVCMLPDDPLGGRKPAFFDFTQEDWKKIIRQTDLLETQILADDKGKLKKTIIRKSTRQIEQRICWEVYHRDHYHCRYCGAGGVPLTVDHLVLWEEGGPTIPENLVACCRRCNRTRGRTQYADWLQSKYYREVSQNLPADIQWRNEDVASTLDKIPKRVHTHKR